MKLALCTTTIHVPHALKLMRKCGPDVQFFVAADEKTPTEAIDFCTYMGESVRTSLSGKKKHRPEGFKCSEALGWNTLARRNIAFLEALAWGADVIYSWDNDNIPTSPYHFVPFDGPNIFDGIKIEKMHEDAWFDPGKLLIPATRHRGFPHRKSDKGCKAEPITDARIGVMAGLVVGDPDIDATTRMEHHPDIGAVHILGQAGVAVDPHTWTVFNSQNTAVIRELVPAWFMLPDMGRHDDIYASLIVQRVARERGLHVHFGSPFTYQQRNEHNLITDLRAEIDGMENVSKLASILDSVILPAKSVIEDVRIIYGMLFSVSFVNGRQYEALTAYLDDCEGVL
jgi:hypothetical protein